MVLSLSAQGCMVAVVSVEGGNWRVGQIAVEADDHYVIVDVAVVGVAGIVVGTAVGTAVVVVAVAVGRPENRQDRIYPLLNPRES